LRPQANSPEARAAAERMRAQPDGNTSAPNQPVARIEGIQPITLKCCHCLGEETKPLNIGTGQQVLPLHSMPWTVNNSPVVPVANPAWAVSAPAQWVGPNGTTNPGTYIYELKFVVPKCVIPASITIQGQFWADNTGTVSLSGPNAPSNTVSTSGGVYGFMQSKGGSFSYTVNNAGGVYTLKVVTVNQSGPTGMLMYASLVKRCATEPRGPRDVDLVDHGASSPR
jgi:hypothetical protein